MNRLFRPAFLTVTATLIFCCMTAGIASATTYYIAANGSDSNNGTSKTTPWQHAPGMPSCSGSCASASPKPGDQFIFRGGDNWHFGAGTPLIGGEWNWQWSGSSGNPIYIGVDTTWYSGSSFARPVLNGDNPLWSGSGFPSSCAHDYSNMTEMVNLSQSWVTFDNFEFTGVCWSSSSISSSGMLFQAGGTSTNDIVSNFYCHGWTMTSGAADQFDCITTIGGGTLVDNNQYVSDVFDGSDSPHFPAGDTTHCQWTGNNTVGCASGQGIYGRANDVHNSVFRYLSDFMVTGTTNTIHDNLFEYLYSSYQNNAQHPNVLNNLGGEAGTNLYVYNNIVRHTFVTENFFLAARTNVYIFNNVFYDNMNSVFGTLPGGCVYLDDAPQATAPVSVYIYNNTMGDSSCQFVPGGDNAPLLAFNGSLNFENNHFIGFTTQALSLATCGSISTCPWLNNGGTITAVHDNGNEIFQSTSTASSQGYVASNNYAPTASGNATVGAGSNLTSSCPTFSVDLDLCSGTSDAASEKSGNGGEIASNPAIPIVPRAASGVWDAGAYQFGGAAPAPPTGLSAVVQ
jgi:hypothetical protein